MRKQAIAYLLGGLMLVGISSCTQDDTMDELMNDIELAQPTANGDDKPKPPPPPDGQ